MEPYSLIIDGDVLVYKFAHSEQMAIEWSPGEWSYTASLPGATFKFEEYMERLKDQFEADVAFIALSDPERNFRKEMVPGYKAHRNGPGHQRPLLYAPMREYLQKGWGAEWHPKLEGDDLMGLRGSQIANPLYVSIDKDLLTIPGTHYNIDKDELTIIDDQVAEYNFWTQVLVGDKTDGYTGIPGIGPVKAAKILDTDDDYETVVLAAYEKAGLDLNEMLTQCTAAWIHRDDSWDFDKGRPIYNGTSYRFDGTGWKRQDIGS